jgi:hypothetical protein
MGTMTAGERQPAPWLADERAQAMPRRNSSVDLGALQPLPDGSSRPTPTLSMDRAAPEGCVPGGPARTVSADAVSACDIVLLVELRGGGSAQHWRAAAARCSAPDAAWLASLGPVRGYFERAAAQMPVEVCRRDHLAHEVVLARSNGRAPASYRITRGCSRLYAAQPGVGVFALCVTATVATARELVELLSDSAFRKDRARIGGVSLAELATDLATGTGVPLDTPELGRIHQIVVARSLPRLARLDKLPVGPAGRRRRGERLAVMCANKQTAGFRRRESNVRYPSEGNSTTAMLTAVTSHTTVLAGVEPGLVAGMTLSAVQCLATAGRAADLRSEAYRLLTVVRDMHVDAMDDSGVLSRSTLRADVSKMSAALAAVRLEQNSSLRAYVDVSVLLPDERVASYHRTLARALGLPAAADLVERILLDLSTAVEQLRVRLDLAEAESLEARNRRVDWVAAAVAAVAVPMTLILGFLGINVRPMAGGAVWSPIYYVWYAGLVAIPVAAVWVAWRQAGRRHP